jgi:serine/threonine protein kinase
MEPKPLTRRKTRDLESMRIDKKVGIGMYGDVFRAIDAKNGSSEGGLVALKKIKMERETQGFPVTALREIKILSNLNHTNVVYLKEVIACSGEETEPSVLNKQFTIGDVFMVFEYVDCDLSALLKWSHFDFTPEIVKSFMYQLLNGLKYLHDNHILHRDIKGANLLITRNHVLKIADLGLARYMPTSTQYKLTNPVVTLWYRAPEVILGSKLYGAEVDLWSVG